MPDTATPPADVRARLWEFVEQCEAQAGPELTVPADGARQLALDLRDLLARATTPGDRDRGRELAERLPAFLSAPYPIRDTGSKVFREPRADEMARLVPAVLRALAGQAGTDAGSRWNAFTSAVYRATDRLAEHCDPAIRGAAAEVVAAIGRYVAATPPASEGEAVTTAGRVVEFSGGPLHDGERRVPVTSGALPAAVVASDADGRLTIYVLAYDDEDQPFYDYAGEPQGSEITRSARVLDDRSPTRTSAGPPAEGAGEPAGGAS